MSTHGREQWRYLAVHMSHCQSHVPQSQTNFIVIYLHNVKRIIHCIIPGEAAAVSSALVCGPAADQRHRLRGGEIAGRVRAEPVQEDLHPQIRECVHSVRGY